VLQRSCLGHGPPTVTKTGLNVSGHVGRGETVGEPVSRSSDIFEIVSEG
jgi:hypothetical protein